MTKIQDLAFSMYEPLHCNEMVACSVHIDELDPEFIKTPRIQLQVEVKSLRGTIAKQIEFAKRLATDIDTRDSEIHKWKKKAATFEQNLDAAQSDLHKWKNKAETLEQDLDELDSKFVK